MKSDDLIRVRHMLEAAEEARGFLGTTPFEEFKKNRLMVNGIVRSLEVIGEAAANITEETKNVHSQIEWPVIVGMRNRLIHAYFDVDYHIVWKTVNENLPPLIDKLKNILEKQT